MIRRAKRLVYRVLVFINFQVYKLTGGYSIKKQRYSESLHRRPYSRVRVACVGGSRFENVADLIDMQNRKLDWERELDIRFGFGLVEFDEYYNPTDIVQRRIADLKTVGVPLVAIAHDESLVSALADVQPDHIFVTVKGLIPKLKESLGIEPQYLPPGIDILNVNPIGWNAEPESKSLLLPNGAPQWYAYRCEYFDAASDKAIIERQARKYRSIFAAILSRERFASDWLFEYHSLAMAARGIPVLIPKKDGVNQSKLPWTKVLAEKELRKEVDKLENRDYRERFSIQHRRIAMNAHNIGKVFELILDTVGIDRNQDPLISIIVSTKRPDLIDFMLGNITKQQGVNKELVLLLHGDGFDRKQIEAKTKQLDYPVTIIERDGDTRFGDNLHMAAQATRGDFVAKMDDDDHYGENHLADLLLAHAYTDAAAVGKWGAFTYLEAKDTTISVNVVRQERYGTRLPGGTLLVRGSLLRQYGFGTVRRAIDVELLERLQRDGYKVYSTHRYNYVRVRHNDHTWDAGDGYFLSRATGPKYQGIPDEVVYV